MLKIVRIAAFKDNYIWLLVNTKTNDGVVVDPGDAKPVLEVLRANNIQLTAILITHHHADHCAGIPQLLEHAEVPVYGPQQETIPHCSHPLSEGDTVNLDALDIQLSVLDIPGHTLGHIAYVGNNMLFCGDTLFTGGCGRLFEGTALQMFKSLKKLKQLPKETLVYCGHEYTLANLEFAMTIEPENKILIQRFEQVKAQTEKREATVPSLLGLELETNPFLRTHVPAVVAAVKKFATYNIADESDILLNIRAKKDIFKPTATV
ncbi:MAG TPA: hydroxyacylglutathione hydrolase [Gammaproteobacteria bacterium]|nr:hydroxyacylglutathione hydrolase [Gammaproteobacteria bacterium]